MTHHENHPIPLEQLAAPAQRALTGAGYTTLEQLAKVSEAKIKELHGIGPNALKILRQTLADHGMTFKMNPGAIRPTLPTPMDISGK